MAAERTFIAIKPDGVQRGLVGEIIGRFERKGFKLVGLKQLTASRELAESHYGMHRERPFFAGLVEFITSGPVVAMVWEGAPHPGALPPLCLRWARLASGGPCSASGSNPACSCQGWP